MTLSDKRGETLVPKAPMVVSETIGGEAVIMHHGTGHYFNAFDTGALIWEAIEQGATTDSLAHLLQQACAIDLETAKQSVDGFVQQLIEHDLVTNSTAIPAVLPTPAALPFAKPELTVHTDLADMLLLDPVHDVDEAGWPAPKAANDGPGQQWPA